jgi:hypothetical protein
VSQPTFESMGRLLRPAALAALLAALVTLAGCGGGADDASVAPAEPISFEQLARAATTSTDATTGRFAFSMEMTMPGTTEPFTFSGEGAYDTTAERASLSLDFSSFARLLGGLFAGLGGANAPDVPDFGDPELWRIDVVQDGTVVYMRLPALGEQLPAGKSWVWSDAKNAGKLEGGGFDFSELQDFAGDDPRELLEFLRAASGEVVTVGTETLRGVVTTHYRATVDLGEYERLVPASEREKLRSTFGEMVEQADVGELPVDVWLDRFGLVRKLSMAFSGTPPGATEPAEASMTFELFDYGKAVEVEVPRPEEVVDASVLDD